MGDLSVEIRVYADEQCARRFGEIELADGVEDELSMLAGKTIYIAVFVEKAQGLPQELSRDAFVKFSFWPAEGNAYEIPKCKTKTINPVFNHTKVFAIRVTDDFIKHVQQTALEFDVMGSGGGDDSDIGMTRNGVSMAGFSNAGGKYNEDDKKRIADLEAQLREMKQQQEEFSKMQNKLMSHPEAKKHVQAAMEVAGVDNSSVCSVM